MTSKLNLPVNYVRDFQDRGYAIIRQVFNQTDIEKLASAYDELKAYANQFTRTYRSKNQLYVYQWAESSKKLLRFVKWPSYTFPVFEQYRTDPRIFKILQPLLGNNIKQITNQASWKVPGDLRTSYAYHQDAYWRTPRETYRDLGSSYIQTFIAIDPHTEENGCLSLIEGSHNLQECYQPKGNVLTTAFNADDLKQYGLENNKKINALLEPGDVVIWGPFMFHGSAPNRTSVDRRAYVNGYVIAENCDRGEFAFLNGAPVPLAEPRLVDYDNLYSRPEPHYI